MSHMHVWESREMLLDDHLPEECPERVTHGKDFVHGDCKLRAVPIKYKFCRCGRTLL